MSRKKKIVKVEIKPTIKRLGHMNHRNGGSMDNREKKMRTRSNINQREIKYSKGEE